VCSSDLPKTPKPQLIAIEIELKYHSSTAALAFASYMRLIASGVGFG
jgi:hypothetical protein